MTKETMRSTREGGPSSSATVTQNTCRDEQVGHVVMVQDDKSSSPENRSQKRSDRNLSQWEQQEDEIGKRDDSSHGSQQMNKTSTSTSHVRSFAGVPRYEFPAAANPMSSVSVERRGLQRDSSQSWRFRSVPPPTENVAHYFPYNHPHNSPPTPLESGCSHYGVPPHQQYHERHHPKTFGGTISVPSSHAQGFGYDGTPPGMRAPYHVSSFESHQMLGGPDIHSTPPPTIAHYHPLYPPPTSEAARGYPVIQWAPIQPVEYVTNIKPDDVLSGRGGATNSHSGNRVFRSLVKRFQSQYLKAKKRDKPAVASIIVEKIREKGGRFLRRIDTARQGRVVWFDIGDDRAREKTCQALREGAPEIRRKRKTASADEDDTTKRSDSVDENERLLCATFSSTDRTPESVDDKAFSHSTTRKATVDMTNADYTYRRPIAKDGPVVIRPSARLLQGRNFQPLSVDRLDPVDREMYLRDFLPPDPTIRRKTTKRQVLEVSGNPLDISSGLGMDTARDHPWPIVKV